MARPDTVAKFQVFGLLFVRRIQRDDGRTYRIALQIML
jgi:hypothetical protein